jgi:hypothetical protein
LQARTSTSGPIRIWVPGCSTGEETYSHAISLVEYLGEERADIPIQIFGTDLSESAIQRARAGVYKENIEADVPPVRLRGFFTSRRRLPDQEDQSGSLHFFHAKRLQRPALFPHGSGQLPQCDDLLESVTAEEGLSRSFTTR